MADAGLRALRVLVIDDSREMCTIVGTVLAAAGVGHVHYASDGRRALEVMASYSIDVAYVDQEMPGLTGMQLIRAVRAMDTSARFMPIIMLTGHSDLKHLYEARDAGVTESPLQAGDRQGDPRPAERGDHGAAALHDRGDLLRPRPAAHEPGGLCGAAAPRRRPVAQGRRRLIGATLRRAEFGGA